MDSRHRERHRGSPEERYHRRRESSTERGDGSRSRRRSRSPHERREKHMEDSESGKHRRKEDWRDNERRPYRHRVDTEEDISRRTGREEGQRREDGRTSNRRDFEDEHTSRKRRGDEHFNQDRRHTSDYRTGGGRRHGRDGDGEGRSYSRHRDQSDVSHESRERGRGPRERRKEEEEDISQYEFGGTQASSTADGEEKKEGDDDQPNYALSGKLAAETNTYKGVVINYSEPPEAKIPKTRWRLYPFKGEEVLSTLYIHRQSAYLVGRDRRVCDMPIDHPSCSKQHAVIQYRLVEYERENGSTGKRVRPYVIDLESTNGTYLNNQRIEAARYYELKEKDMLKFGFSSREYVILHENSKEELELDEGTVES